MRDPRTLGYLLALGSAATGAVRFNLAVYAKAHGLTLVWFLLGALIVGILCSGTHVIVKDGLNGFGTFRGKRVHALLYGLLMAWSSLSHFLALDYINEVVMSSLAQTTILVTIGLAVWLLGERFTAAEWVAAAIICFGIFWFKPWTGDLRTTGFLIVMSGVMAGSFATIGAKRWVVGIPPRVLMVWRNVVAFVVVGIYILARGTALPEVTPWTLMACIAAGILGPYLHGLFFLQALERVDAAKATLMSRIAPVIVFLVSWAFLSRVPELKDTLGAGVLLIGVVWLAAVRPAPKRRNI